MDQTQCNLGNRLDKHVAAETAKKTWETPTLTIASVDEAEIGPIANPDAPELS